MQELYIWQKQLMHGEYSRIFLTVYIIPTLQMCNLVYESADP